jgi:hypothetical protein
MAQKLKISGIKLAFYVASQGNYQDKLIGWWTRGPYSHVEIVFPNGEWFSASTRDKGVRFKKIVPGPMNWEYFIFNIQEQTVNEIYSWCETQVGKPYDWLGAFGMGFKYPTKKLETTKNKWFCSEICSNPLIRANKLQLKTDQLSPNCLFRYLTSGTHTV